MGILGFLLQWSAVNQVAHLSNSPLRQGPLLAPGPGSGLDPAPAPASLALHAQWGLIHEFQDLPEGDIEKYLPQICSILVADPGAGTGLKDERMLSYLDNVIIDKCDNCLPFGFKLTGFLKVGYCTVRLLLLLIASYSLCLTHNSLVSII
jgi:hypothetical protein